METMNTQCAIRRQLGACLHVCVFVGVVAFTFRPGGKKPLRTTAAQIPLKED
jgi:cbb3-type cytochrome oxidase subunit 3